METVRLSADHAFLLRFLFPRAKFLFLIRNPYDAFRSYDTIRRERHVQWFHRWPDQPVTAREFGRHWCELTASYLNHHEELGARVIFYEDLIGGRVDLHDLEDYLGVAVDREAMKANPGGWPVSRGSIDEKERDAFFAEVEELAESLGYFQETIEDLAQSTGRPHLPTRSSSASQASSEQSLDGLLRAAMALQQQGATHQAVEKCQAILRKDAGHAGAWHLLGLSAFCAGDHRTACQHISRAVTLCSTKPVYHNNYGAVLLELGQVVEAKSAIQRAIELNRDYADAWANLGRAQQFLADPMPDVERSFLNALTLQPGHPEALLHLADLYRNQHRHDDSIRICKDYLQQYPGDAEALTKLGKVLGLAKRLDEAVDAIENAIAANPTDHQLHLALATLQGEREEIEGARLSFVRAAELCPQKRIWSWKHLALCPAVFPDEESIDRYWDRLNTDLDRALSERIPVDWRTLPQDGFTSPFNLPHHNRCCREVKEKFAALFEGSFSHTLPAVRAEVARGGRIRVGFLVNAGHEAGFIRGTAGVVEQLDRKRFEPVILCDRRAVNRFRKAIGRVDLSITPFPARFDQAVEAIRAARCDVIYYWKVGADPWNFFLPMARLAPVQCTSWGTHGTSGVGAVDYYLSSPWMENPDSNGEVPSHYTERVHMLNTFPTFQRREEERDPCTRNDFDLPSEGAIYFCPHRLPKYHPQFDGYLKGILDSDPTGRLVLLSGKETVPQAVLEQRLRRNLGQSLFSRVRIMPAMQVHQYYRLLSLATVVLDSPAYVGGITAYDAFSLGVPVITQAGPLAVQSYTGGLYRRMGIEGLTTRDREQYVHAAVRVGRDAEYRQELSRQILERGESVFDDPEVTPAHQEFFEAALRERTT